MLDRHGRQCHLKPQLLAHSCFESCADLDWPVSIFGRHRYSGHRPIPHPFYTIYLGYMKIFMSNYALPTLMFLHASETH